MDIDENMLNSVFAYNAPTNEEKKNIKLDENCIAYNSSYKSYQFYENKFPEGYESIPAFDKVIEAIVEKSQSKTPLDELLARQKMLSTN